MYFVNFSHCLCVSVYTGSCVVLCCVGAVLVCSVACRASCSPSLPGYWWGSRSQHPDWSVSPLGSSPVLSSESKHHIQYAQNNERKTAHNDTWFSYFVWLRSKVKDRSSSMTSNSDTVLLGDILSRFFFSTLLALWITVSEFMFHLDLRQSFWKPHINSRDFSLREMRWEIRSNVLSERQLS